nr:hypothetical protein [Nitrosomonas nitrosa]
MSSRRELNHGKWAWLRGWRAGVIMLSCAVAAAALLLGWHRVASVSFLALAVAALPCGVACALGIWLLDRRKGAGNCHGGEGNGAVSK